MGNIHEQDLLDEIRFDIKENDLLKARLVLSSLEHVSRKTQKQALFEVSRANDNFAIPLLVDVIANSPEISESFPQIKETMFAKILDSPEVLLDLLSNAEDSVNKAFLAELAGEIRLEQAAPVLLEILNKEDDLKTIESAIISLGMISSQAAVAAVSKYLYAEKMELVMASIRTLGVLATPEAIQKLGGMLGRDSDLDLIILDIIAKIQIPDALEILNKTLDSQHAHLRTAVKKKLSEIGVMSVRVLINNLSHKNPDLVIHSLNVLGDIGDSAAVPPVRKLLHNYPEDPNIRFAAYETLGRLPLGKGVFMLAAGLSDPVDNVRDAAAKAIDRNYDAVLAGGIRHLTRTGDMEALKIITTIINSQCSNIFLDLLEEEFFKTPAVNYLTNKAHPDVRSHFAEILARAGHDDIAKQVIPEKVTAGKAKLKVFAVDDSKMILTIYRTVLHNLGCESHLFEFPVGALGRIQKEKPDVILTDLNMPDITGIDLTKSVRQLYSKEDLPIIMITTQDEAQDKKAAYAAGVNGILQKPFTEEQIGEVLVKFAGKQHPS
jgi:CheY-like chemotaxis protein